MILALRKKSSEKLSEKFNSDEFDCHCSEPSCVLTYVDTDLIAYLERKRSIIKQPFIIVSGFRCHNHNSQVGGKPGSYHLIGKAADIQIPSHDMFKMADLFEDADGLGRYPGRHFIHVDVRGYKSRWEG